MASLGWITKEILERKVVVAQNFETALSEKILSLFTGNFPTSYTGFHHGFSVCILPAKRVNLVRFGKVIKKGAPFINVTNPFICFGAGARNRTGMPLRAGDFESKISKITITY